MSLHNIYACFNAFDKDGDGGLNIDEFRLVCNALFRNDRGFVYKLPEPKIKEMFDIFDKNVNGVLEIEEFMFCWYNWFKFIIHPRSVCIVVNMQNDYISGVMALAAAALDVPTDDDQGQKDQKDKKDKKDKKDQKDQKDAEDEPKEEPKLVSIIEPINIIIGTCEFEKIYYVMDWHPGNHISFYDNISMRPLYPTSKVTEEDAQLYDTVVFALGSPYEQRLWPKHCVENTWGSELHQDLRMSSKGTKIYTGTNPERDQFSAFRDSTMAVGSFNNELMKLNITDVYVVGYCTDMCVRATCLDALSLGYRTILVEDCCLPMNPILANQTKLDVLAKNGVVVSSQDVKNMTEGKDRRGELGYTLCMRLKDWNKRRESRSGATLR